MTTIGDKIEYSIAICDGGDPSTLINDIEYHLCKAGLNNLARFIRRLNDERVSALEDFEKCEQAFADAVMDM